MQARKDSSVKSDPRLEAVRNFLNSLELSSDDEGIQEALMKMDVGILIVVDEYCSSKDVKAKKAAFVLESVLSSYQPHKINYSDIKIVWPGLPVAEYVQNTAESQYFVSYRSGGEKSLRLGILNALIIELRKLETITDDKKIKIAKAYLNKTLEDTELWESGENGKKAIIESISNFNHIESILKDENELDLLKVLWTASKCVSAYRSHVNVQFDYKAFFTWGYYSRQGFLNLTSFAQFLTNANAIAKDTSIDRVDRANKIIIELNSIRQELYGDDSPKVWQKLYNIFNKYVKDHSVEHSEARIGTSPTFE